MVVTVLKLSNFDSCDLCLIDLFLFRASTTAIAASETLDCRLLLNLRPVSMPIVACYSTHGCRLI